MASELQVSKLVLLPGMDGTGTLFDPFIQSLPSSLKPLPIAFPPNQPLSYPELADFVRARLPASEPFALLAESFSTPLAIQIAALSPAGLKALILVAGFAANPAYAWARRIAPMLPASRSLFPLAGFLLRRFLLGSGAPSSLLTSLKRALNTPDPKVFSSRLHSILHCDCRLELAHISVPILYIQAGKDRVVPRRCLHQIQHVKPDITVRKIAGPHLILQREPRQCSDIVATFIEKLEGKQK